MKSTKQKQGSALFKTFGVELEYMVVDKASLNIRPVADAFFLHQTGSYEGEFTRKKCQWSNELALHVMELKNAKPVPTLNHLADHFQESVYFVNAYLNEHKLCLMPSGMHPWMRPSKESKLWPHDNSVIYDTFNRIFGCKGHGWTNLQSTHVNLPFSTDEEFKRLHTAIRLILPIIPALSASSPVREGQLTRHLDYRLKAYQNNCKRIPSVTGGVVPDLVHTREAYKETVLNRIYSDMKDLDPEGVLKHEWVNARGAIARFDRNTIEIRVIDNQECPAADLAIVRLIIKVLQALCQESLSDLERQMAMESKKLRAIFSQTLLNAGEAVIRNRDYPESLGLKSNSHVSASELWDFLMQKTCPTQPVWLDPVRCILKQGCLATRIKKRLGPRPSQRKLHLVYKELCECLNEGRQLE